MFRRYASIFIALFVLAANTAWAADFTEVFSGHDDETTHVLSHDEANSENCDHCCHGAAHFLGILPTVSLDNSDTHALYLVSKSAAIISRTYQPPTPPPNV